MSQKDAIKKKHLAQFSTLIKRGEVILGYFHYAENIGDEDPEDSKSWVRSHFDALRTNSLTLFDHILPNDSIHRKNIDTFINKLHYDRIAVLSLVSKLKSIKEDYKKGFLDQIFHQIEASVAVDYMGQAEKLIKEGSGGKNDHVPAAVLAGAVLEKSLRSLCVAQTPSIPTSKAKKDGKKEPLCMNDLITALRKQDVFNEPKAKELRGFADIRNAAAHGKFEEFDKGQVKRMIEGVNSFIAGLS